MRKRDIIRQVRNEYEEARSYLEPWKERKTQQLRLMNNLQRSVQSIASTMLPSYFNRVFSAIYSNTPSVKFVPGNDTELYATSNLNKMAISDAQEMGMSMLDYDWSWDACFYGRGYLETLRWVKSRMITQPEVINPMFFQYDPYFAEKKNWRYYDKWKLVNKHELEMLIEDGLITKNIGIDDIETGVDPYIWTWKIQAELAKGVNPPATDTMVPSSNIYQILEHFTYIDGKKSIVWTNRSITKVLRVEPLDLNDNPDRPGESEWPITIKVIFREPHSSAPVGVPDLIEDKQRAKNVLLNLGYTAVKDEVNPIYEYVPEDLINPSQLFQRQISQHISVKKLGSVKPLETKGSMSSSSLAFLGILGQESADVLGTGQPPQIGQKKKSATQDQILQQIADLAQSLQQKLAQEGVKEFWGTWYQRLINNKKDGDVKMVALTDALGTTFEQIELDKIKTLYPPRVLILNVKEAEYKEMVERRELAGQMKLLEGILPPGSMRLFLKNIYFPKFKTLDNSSIDLVLPKTSDEIVAEQENEALSAGEWVDVNETDDHEAHLYIHSRGKRTAEMNTHIIVHQYALAENRKKAQAEAADQGAKQDEQGTPGADKQPEGSGVGKGKPQNTTGAEAATSSAIPSSAPKGPA